MHQEWHQGGLENKGFAIVLWAMSEAFSRLLKCFLFGWLKVNLVVQFLCL